MFALNLPAAHIKHAILFPVYPPLHAHDNTLVLPSGEVLLLKHCVHITAPLFALYVPAEQFEHTLPFPYLPAEHCVHVPPFSPTNPTLHLQLVFNELPLKDEESAGQSRQIELPIKFLYLPAAQMVHELGCPVQPVLHRHSAISLLPAGEKVFVGQSVQFTLPLSGLYLPAMQGTHVSAFGPENPLLHLQELLYVLYASDHEFVGQFTHVLVVAVACCAFKVDDARSIFASDR